MAERMPVDEGRIHEWLDGQLSAAEGAEVESLVANDPAWADALAEARGLIAASRRITSALDDVPADVIPVARPASGAVEVRALPSRPVQPNARRPRVMVRTWRNAAAMLVVFVGSGLVWRFTRQTPDILSPTLVAEATAPAEPAAAMPAPAGDVDAVASRSERPTSLKASPKTAPAGAAAAAPSANAIVADAATAVAGGSAASVETQALRAAESAAPPLPSVMVPRVVAQADSTVIVGREQRRSASELAAPMGGAAAAPAAAPAMAKAERRRAAPGIAGLGERCVEASIFNPPQGWPARIALETAPLGNGQSMAFAQFNGPVAGRWIGAGWRRGEGGSIEVTPVQMVGTLLLSSTDAKSPQGLTVGVLWGPCSTRSTGEM